MDENAHRFALSGKREKERERKEKKREREKIEKKREREK